MSSQMNTSVATTRLFNTSHIGRDERHCYISFASVLPAFFAGKYWRFYLSSDKVREPHPVDPNEESVSFFVETPAVTGEIWTKVARCMQGFAFALEPRWYDVESDQIVDSSINYLPLSKNILDIVCERASFKHSLVDLEPSKEDVITLAFARVREVYSKVEEVSAIYVSRYLDDITITVLLCNAKYSRSLMDKLFEIEYTLHKQTPSLVMEFLYLPSFLEDRTDVIHPKAELIYDRETSAILSGPSVSSET